MYAFGGKEMACQISIKKTNLYSCNPTDKAIISIANSPKRYPSSINNRVCKNKIKSSENAGKFPGKSNTPPWTGSRVQPTAHPSWVILKPFKLKVLTNTHLSEKSSSIFFSFSYMVSNAERSMKMLTALIHFYLSSPFLTFTNILY
jgi:hypothetical protein